ncbi:MAG: NAD-dependent epimerase/dehydratase family protein [Smithella sp.]
MSIPTVAILGATSHIAKSLIAQFLAHGGFNLHLYARAPERMQAFLETLEGGKKTFEINRNFQAITQHAYDVLINCVGVGTHKKLQGDYTRYFKVTEEFDNLVLAYLINHNPDALYIRFSSGAVYGHSFSAPVTEDSVNSIMVNHITPQDYYGIAQLNAEAKHRAFKGLKIVDLRLFSYFSRFIDISEGYFITEVMDCILHHKILETDEMNIVRDYVDPDDLFTIILQCMQAGRINTALDVTSAKPVEKKEILDYFSENHGLRYEVLKSINNASPTGSKNTYCSDYRNAETIGFYPHYHSMETIIREAKYILGSGNIKN